MLSLLRLETERDESHYLLSEGDWFAVDRDFVRRIDTRGRGNPREFDLRLPSARRGEQSRLITAGLLTNAEWPCLIAAR